MWLAPLFGFIGLLPFVWQLNLGVLGFLGVMLGIVLVSYLLAASIGGIGYLILRRFNRADNAWLMAYAALCVAVTAPLVQDWHAILVFGPPTLLVAAAFCYLRGPPADETTEAAT